ncbi:hypothetical protein LNQ03_32350 [Klebsiella pneumoniae subsp. pneumoniae]|nr:hypothetical protein [Klebsiella pneumoniae subsp. pneumoniae]
MKANFPALWLLALHNNHSLRQPAPLIQKIPVRVYAQQPALLRLMMFFPLRFPVICVNPRLSPVHGSPVALFLLTQAMRYKRWPFSLSICPAFEYRAFFSGDAVTGKKNNFIGLMISIRGAALLQECGQHCGNSTESGNMN